MSVVLTILEVEKRGTSEGEEDEEDEEAGEQWRDMKGMTGYQLRKIYAILRTRQT